ncbi:MAG: DUF389 domain-containing protein [Longimicrobiales bacterium]
MRWRHAEEVDTPRQEAAVAFETELAETLERLQRNSAISSYNLTLMGLSGILVSVALLTDSVPVLIGAMLVAPAFPPLALLALTLVLGRWATARYALVAAMTGLAAAVVMAMLTTWFLNVAGIIPEYANLVRHQLLEERVRPGWYSMAVALAAGIAGMLAEIRNRMDALIGTVASVALVPAGGAAAIAFIAGDPGRALGGMVLLGINVVLIVATGMMVLLAIGRGR